MKFFLLPNLQSSKTDVADAAPGSVPDDKPLPDLPNKNAYREWCADANTQHAFYNAVEGLTPGLRVSESNPAWKIWGLVGEFDAPQAADWKEKAKSAKIPPAWVSDTYTPGHARMVWAFASPVNCANETFVREFYRIAWQAIHPSKLGLNFREDESSKPAQYFEFGRGWAATGGVVPVEVVEGWVAKACRKVKWEREAALVPFDRLQAEGEKQFPGAWPGGWGEFRAGARGVRFWEPGADAQSVIVVETGCVCFTGDRAFLPWADIFGKQFVDEAASEAIGKAITGIWWEPRSNKYWKRYPTGQKVPLREKDLDSHLKRHGLTGVVPKGARFSQVDDAIWTLQQMHVVDGVGPWMYRQDDVIEEEGKRYLNDSMVRLAPPAPDAGVWAKGFPVIAEYLELAYGPEQLPYLLGWMAHYYQSCLRGEPERGLAVFIAGDTDSGKSFLSFAILRLLFGAQQDASKFLTGQEAFNENLVGCPIWTIDDAIASTDTASRNKFTQIIKQQVANDRICCRGMHKSPVTVTWKGRIVVTMNDDEESIRMIPNLDLSNRDKVSLFKVESVKGRFSWLATHGGKFPLDSDVLAEIPFLGAYLRDLDILPPVWSGGRFSITPFHHPELVAHAEDASDTVAAEEMLNDWRHEYFAELTEQAVTLSPTQLLRSVVMDDVRRAQFRTANALSRCLNGMLKRGVKWISRGRHKHTRWVKVTNPKLDIA